MWSAPLFVSAFAELRRFDMHDRARTVPGGKRVRADRTEYAPDPVSDPSLRRTRLLSFNGEVLRRGFVGVRDVFGRTRRFGALPAAAGPARHPRFPGRPD